MRVLYDKRDVRHARKLDDRRFQWVEELGGRPLQDMPADAAGFLFGYQGSAEDYRKLVHDRPNISDRSEARKNCATSILSWSGWTMLASACRGPNRGFCGSTILSRQT